MQRLNFGRIEGLEIRNGEPVFQPLPKVVQDIKIGGENGPRPELAIEDFALRNSVLELFEHISQLGNGRVETLEIKYGLPFKLIIQQPFEIRSSPNASRPDPCSAHLSSDVKGME
jgi:hypothetical protein